MGLTIPRFLALTLLVRLRCVHFVFFFTRYRDELIPLDVCTARLNASWSSRTDATTLFFQLFQASQTSKKHTQANPGGRPRLEPKLLSLSRRRGWDESVSRNRLDRQNQTHSFRTLTRGTSRLYDQRRWTFDLRSWRLRGRSRLRKSSFSPALPPKLVDLMIPQSQGQSVISESTALEFRLKSSTEGQYDVYNLQNGGGWR